MNIEKIAAKLRPLMPEKVDSWMRARDLAEPDLKVLLEKQIISCAYETFRDFHNKILLSLPPERAAKGSIHLGTVLYDREKWPLGLRYGEIIQNMAILGRSGAGKTNVTFHVLRQLIDKKIPFVFLDWKRTVRHLIPDLNERIDVYTPGRAISKLPFNPFVVPPGIEPNVYVNQVVDAMSEAFTLGDGSRSLVRKAIASIYRQGNLCPTTEQLIAELEKLPDRGRAGGWKITALRAMESLEFAEITSTDPISQQQLAQRMLSGNTVIELDALGQESKKFLIPLLCLWLYYVRLGSSDREKLKLVIFIEEAHHVLHKRLRTAHETALEMLFRQCRELGIGIVVIDQHPHLLSSAALGNTYTTVFLNQKDPADMNAAASVCLLDSEERNYLSMLPVGQGIVKMQDRWARPIHVKFPLVNIRKGSVTDAILARYSAMNRAGRTGSGRNTSVLCEIGRVPRFPLLDIPLSEEALRFLEDVLSYPDDGVKIRYQRLGMSTGSANRLKETLLRQGWIESRSVELGQTRKTCLRLTGAAMEILNIQQDQTRHGSIVHEYWKRFWAQRLREQGWRVELEAPRESGRIDVVGHKDDREIAVEIETGKSDFLGNIRHNLAAGYDHVVVVATDKAAYRKIEEQLGRAGLLIPRRVQLLVGSEYPRWS